MSAKSALAAATFALCLASAGTALAQSSSGLQPFPVTGLKKPGSGSDGGVKISVSYQFFLEGETDTMEDQATLADKGRKHLYQLLANECVVLKQTIAQTCAIERANVNAQLRDGNRRQVGVRISGSATYQISLKEDAEAAKRD